MRGLFDAILGRRPRPAAIEARALPAQSVTAREVFLPGAIRLPHTYISRQTATNELREALLQPHSVILFHGPSKSGKTVLCMSELSDMPLLRVCGYKQITDAEFWYTLRRKLSIPDFVEESDAIANEGVRIEATDLEGGLNAAIKITTTDRFVSQQREFEQAKRANSTNAHDRYDALSVLAERPHTILIDDFHWIEKDQITAILQPLKQAIETGSRVVLISVPKERFVSTSELSDIFGRCSVVQMPRWEWSEIRDIAIKGFDALNVDLQNNTAYKLARNTYQNPLLMQGFCASLCFRNKIFARLPQRSALDFSSDTEIEKLVRSYADRTTQNFDPIRKADTKSWRIRGGRLISLNELIVLGISHNHPFAPYNLDSFFTRLNERILVSRLTPQQKSAITRRLSELQDHFPGAYRGTPPVLYDSETRQVTMLDPAFKLWARWRLSPEIGAFEEPN